MKHDRNLSGGCQIALKEAPIDGRRDLRPTVSLEELAAAGWAIVPVEAGGKRPLVAWTRYKERGVSPEQIGEWRKQFPNCNWGVLLGSPSGNLIAIDIDGPEGQAWCDEQGGFTRFPTAWHNTGRGWHYFYRVPDELATLGVVKPHPQVEFRISDCLCLIPPSIHENGERYEWRIPPNPGGKTTWLRVNGHRLVKSVWPIPMAPEWVGGFTGAGLEVSRLHHGVCRQEACTTRQTLFVHSAGARGETSFGFLVGGSGRAGPLPGLACAGWV